MPFPTPLCRAFAALCAFTLVPLAQSQTPTFRTDHYSASDSLHAVAVELNEDGALDFVIGGGQVELSNGDGTYRSGGTIPGASGFVVASGDFNNDSNADVVLANGSSFQIAYGNGTGGFSKVTTYAGISGTQIENAVAIPGRFGDGRVDLAVMVVDGFGPGQQKIYTLINTGTGFDFDGPWAVEFAFHNPIDGVDYSWSPGDLVLGDFDADGHPDLAYSVKWFSTNVGPGPDHTKLVVLYGTGAEFDNEHTPLDQDGNYSVASGDMNQDGKSDLAGSNGTCSGSVCGGYIVFYGSTTRFFTKRQQFDANAGFISPVIADFNGDHRQDIAMIAIDAAHDTFGIRVGTQNADGSFTSQPYYVLGFYHSQSGTSPARFLLTGDFDRNRKPDLMTVSETDLSQFVVINTTAKQSANQFPSCSQPGGRGFHLCAPLDGSTVSSPVNFRVGAADYKPIRKVELWLNGQKQFQTFYSYANYSYADKTLSLAAGTYNATLFTADYGNVLQKKSFTFTVSGGSTCAPPTNPAIVVCSPANGSTVSSPVSVLAYARLSEPIYRFELWVGGVKVVTVRNSGTMSASVPLSAGTHRFDFVAQNLSGSNRLTKSVSATVK